MNPRILCRGDWSAEQVLIAWTANTRRLVPEVETAIDVAWNIAMARPGVHLFDGPMCRLESWHADENRLHLQLSKSSYKPFLGTNMCHPEFATTFGPDVMANPVGVSPALLTCDGFLLFGRRNASVAYYPGRIHPFAGSLEPKDADVFAAITRELHEELSVAPADLINLRCTGIAEDISLAQPELIFAAESNLTRSQIASRLDRAEHNAIWSIPATAAAISTAIADERQLTPIAIAAMRLWGRLRFGDGWFNQQV